MSLIPSQLNLTNGAQTSTITQDSGANNDLVITCPNVYKIVSTNNSQMVFQSTGGASFSGSLAVTGSSDVSTASYSLNTIGATQTTQTTQISNIISVLNTAFGLSLS